MGAWKHHGKESGGELLRWGELKTKWRLSGLELGWDLNSAFPVTPTELHSCKKGKWKEGKWGAARSRCQKWPLVPAGRSRAALWSWDGRMAFEEPPGETDRAVKWEHVTHDTDAWQALAYGNLWMLFSLTCTLDIARSKRDFGEELVKCITKEKVVLSWGLMSKQDRARPHYFAVSHIYLPFIPFLNWNTSSDHRVILMWWAHPCTVMFGLVNQHGEISETFGEIFSEIVLYLRTRVLRQLFCCSFVVWGTDPTSKEKGVIIFQAFVNFFFLLTNLL